MSTPVVTTPVVTPIITQSVNDVIATIQTKNVTTTNIVNVIVEVLQSAMSLTTLSQTDRLSVVGTVLTEIIASSSIGLTPAEVELLQMIAPQFAACCLNIESGLVTLGTAVASDIEAECQSCWAWLLNCFKPKSATVTPPVPTLVTTQSLTPPTSTIVAPK